MWVLRHLFQIIVYSKPMLVTPLIKLIDLQLPQSSQHTHHEMDNCSRAWWETYDCSKQLL